MPKINIREEEVLSYAQFNATENTVLVPVFVTDDTLLPRKYRTAYDFRVGENALPINSVASYISAQNPDVYLKDKSYAMICELLDLGLEVVVDPIFVEGSSESATFEAEVELIEALNDKISNGEFEKFKDKNLYNIKFITSGAWPNILLDEDSEGSLVLGNGSYSTMVKAAEDRGDCVALIEFESDIDLDKIIEAAKLVGGGEMYKYAACFYPAGRYSIPSMSGRATYSYFFENSKETTLEMPGAYGYLMAYGNSVKFNSNWFAAAGTVRGYVPSLNKLNYEVGEALMHVLQGDNGTMDSELKLCINPIMQVGTYGTRVWGNRVARRDSVDDVYALRYSSFLNVRILVCDIKKQLYHSALRITYEPNDDIAWNDFKKLNNSLLDQMQTGRGLQWYRWTKVITDQKATIKAILTIKPIEAVEYFDIVVRLTDEDLVIFDEESEI